MGQISSTQISESSLTTLYANEYLTPGGYNGNLNALKARINTLVSETSSYCVTLGDVQTITAAKTFSGAVTFSGLVTLSGSISLTGINDTFILLDSDNVGAAAACSIRFERGSSGSDAQIQWDTSKYILTTDGSTKSKLQVANGTTTDDVVTYDQVGKLTTTNTWTVLNTFTLLPQSSAVPSAGADLTNKTYVDLQVFGNAGITQSTTPPAATLGALFLDTDDFRFYRGNGSSFNEIVWAVNPLTDIDLTGAPPASATDSLLGLGIDIASGSANGTFLGINKASFTGNFIDAQVNGASKFKVTSAGLVTAGADGVSGTDLTTVQQMDIAIAANSKSKVQFLQTTTSTDYSGTTTEATILIADHGSLTVSSADVAAGTTIKLDIYGTWRNSDDATEDSTVRLKVGGVTLGTITFNSSTTTNTINFRATVNYIIQNENASGTVHYDYSFEPQAFNGTTPCNTTDWNVTNSYGVGSGTVDTTGSLVLDITGQESGAPSGSTSAVLIRKATGIITKL